MLKPVRNDAKGKRLDSCSRVLRPPTVRQDAGELDDLRNPAAVLLLLDLNKTPHAALAPAVLSGNRTGSGPALPTFGVQASPAASRSRNTDAACAAAPLTGQALICPFSCHNPHSTRQPPSA